MSSSTNTVTSSEQAVQRGHTTVAPVPARWQVIRNASFSLFSWSADVIRTRSPDSATTRV